MSQVVFKYNIRQNPYSGSIRTVKCGLYDNEGILINEIEKTFHGFLPFQFFWIELFVKASEKRLRRLNKLVAIK